MDEKLKMFLKYPNAEIVLYDLETFFFENIVSAIGFEITDFSDCKIRLKSLEDMTVDERRELNLILQQADICYKITDIVYTYTSMILIQDKIREWSFDIDGLIEKDWAERITE